MARTRMRPNERRRHRFYHLVQMFRLTRGVDGDVAEAGCYRGCSSFLLCRERLAEDARFTGDGYHAIDSFNGISKPRPIDGRPAAERWNQRAFCDTSPEMFRHVLKEFPDLRLHVGWVPAILYGETTDERPVSPPTAAEGVDVSSRSREPRATPRPAGPDVAPARCSSGALADRRYRFVHIDVDVYEPTLACLEFFWPRLSPGGAIVIDDYGPPLLSTDDAESPLSDLWCGCVPAVIEFTTRHQIPLAILETGNAVVFKRGM
ncbi:MAG: TylF/MycF/NovP-related O-methyltransferase [Planctomycetota bacterium]